MTLLELCEPLFQYICILNRAGRKGGNLEYPTVRAQVKALLEDLRNKALVDPRLKPQYALVEKPLIFFVDSMISESGLTFASKWHQNRLAYEFNELAGDEKFFDLFDETASNTSDEATERLGVYYTCIGLGFTGWYSGQPEYLRKRMLEIAPRLRGLIDSDATARICPEAYHTDTRNLVEPPSRKMGAIAIVFVVFALTTMACNFFLFKNASDLLTNSLRQIIAHGPEVEKAQY
jgi:type VI protein secretion system component VasF